VQAHCLETIFHYCHYSFLHNALLLLPRVQHVTNFSPEIFFINCPETNDAYKCWLINKSNGPGNALIVFNSISYFSIKSIASAGDTASGLAREAITVLSERSFNTSFTSATVIALSTNRSVTSVGKGIEL
jgi:hypothetical protein